MALTGRWALVTGGTRGIGAAIVTELLSHGCKVIAVSRKAPGAESAQKGVKYLEADISHANDREKVLKEASACTGELESVSILVNNAAFNIRKPTADYSAVEFDSLLRTNFVSVFHLSQLFLPSLKRFDPNGTRGGASVVNISSVSGGMARTNTGSPYGAIKSGINGLTRSLAAEWAPLGIRVNGVAPWYIETPLVTPLLADEAYKRKVLARTPMGRVGRPEEVAGVVSALCSPKFSFVTGTTIDVDGGFTCSGFAFEPPSSL